MPRTSLQTYSDKSIVNYYAALEGLQDCERHLFDRHLKAGMRILDMGVGAGRTTERLSREAASYVGADYSEAMIDACRKRYPSHRFEVMDASDLSRFANESFDACVFAFNGLDYLHPDEKRLRCIAECRRVLTPNGLFILSIHNAKACIVWPRTYDAPSYKIAWRIVRAFFKSIQLTGRVIFEPAFWKGKGTLTDPTHGGLLTRVATPEVVMEEMGRYGFELLECVGSLHPHWAPTHATPWYYYAFAKRDSKPQ